MRSTACDSVHPSLIARRVSACRRVKYSLFGVQRAGPLALRRAVARDGGGDLPAAHLLQCGEPALELAVDHRRVPDEQQVAEEQRAAGLVEHGQVGVGVGGGPGVQAQLAVAEVEFEPLLDGQRGRHDARLGIGAAEVAPQRVQVEGAALLQRGRQPHVAHELRRLRAALEGFVAQHVVGVGMGVDDVADRHRARALDRGAEGAAVARRAAAVDHRRAAAADHQAEIGDATAVRRAPVLEHAAAHVDARRQRLQRRGSRGRRIGRRGGRAEERHERRAQGPGSTGPAAAALAADTGGQGRCVATLEPTCFRR